MRIRRCLLHVGHGGHAREGSAVQWRTSVTLAVTADGGLEDGYLRTHGRTRRQGRHHQRRPPGASGALARLRDLLRDLASGAFLLVPVAPILLLVLYGLGSEVVLFKQQGPIQRGIDAHAVRVHGTYAGLRDKDSKWDDDLYVVDYEYEGRPVRVELLMLPGWPSAGDRVCLEINAHHPTHARPCGTRGDLDDAKNGMAIGSAFLAGLLLLWLLFVWRMSA
jgi:hypothetical protein